jgi:phosphonate transport system substrate-binding protein
MAFVAGMGAARGTELCAATLVIGEVTHAPRRSLERLETLAGWIAGQPGLERIRRGSGRVVPELAMLGKLLAQGEVDIASIGVVGALHLEAQGVADIMLREWRGNRPVYRSVIIVRKDSELLTLDALKGKRIAFLNGNSTPGFLAPLAMLRASGLEVVRLANRDAPVPRGKIGYVFAGARVNIPFWVVRGVVSAGGYSDRDWEIAVRTPRRLQRKLRILIASPPMIRSLIVVRRGLDPAIRRAVVAALTGMGDDREAAAVRSKYYKVTRFEKMDGQAKKMLIQARHYYRLVAGDVR